MASEEKLQVHDIRFFDIQPLPINCISYDSSSKRAAVSRSDGSVQILSANDNWVQEQSFPGGEGSSVEALVWCQQRLFAAGLGGNVVELDLDTQLTKSCVSSNAGPIWCLTGNREENCLAAGTEDGCVVLFSIDDGLEFQRFFGKQEGRIISIAWYSSQEGENIIVTGGANDIRQWSVNSGQPISRMTLGGYSAKDTLVWCLTVTKDFTIISGDSRGVVTFWNGKLSTQMKTFHCHKADVLCLCLNRDQSILYTSGVDSAVHKFTCCTPDPNSDRKRWIYQLLHHKHTHDVRALACTNQTVLSGGVDCALWLADVGASRCKNISPFPSQALVDLDREHNLVLLQHRKHLELWRLGSANTPPTEKVSGILSLSRNPLKLIQINAREGQEVICSALGSNGLVAFSDLQQVRLYRFDQDKAESPNPTVHLERVKHTFPHPARLMTFTPSGHDLVAVLAGADLEVMETKTGRIKHKLSTDSSIHLIAASQDSTHIAYATLSHEVFVADVTSGEVVCRCPVVSSQVSAMSFSPHANTLIMAHCNQKIFEIDLEKKKYSTWSRHHSPSMNPHWLEAKKNIKGILFHPDRPGVLYLYTETCLASMRKDDSDTSSQKVPVHHRARKSYKYMYILHADFLQDGSLALVERPPSMIEDQFPPSLKQKKFAMS